MIKTSKRGVYATPDFDLEVIRVEGGFALSFDPDNGTENFEQDVAEDLC